MPKEHGKHLSRAGERNFSFANKVSRQSQIVRYAAIDQKPKICVAKPSIAPNTLDMVSIADLEVPKHATTGLSTKVAPSTHPEVRAAVKILPPAYQSYTAIRTFTNDYQKMLHELANTMSSRASSPVEEDCQTQVYTRANGSRLAQVKIVTLDSPTVEHRGKTFLQSASRSIAFFAIAFVAQALPLP